MSPTDLTRSEREALKAIYRFTRDGSEAHTGALAERLSLSPGTVTTLVKRLADRELVDHRPYQGVRFTDEGRRAAVAAIRRHRIVERFLADMLGYKWNEADELAVAFEHELPDEVPTVRMEARRSLLEAVGRARLLDEDGPGKALAAHAPHSPAGSISIRTRSASITSPSRQAIRRTTPSIGAVRV